MSVSDAWGDKETPCPECGGAVTFWNFDADCRGNKPASGIQCTGCKKKFTAEEWSEVEKQATST